MSSLKAYELLTFNDKSQKFELNAEALTFIRKLPSPLSIVSVAGVYRTGKSYLLNRVILDRNQGFKVGPTINACTKGLWIWGEAIQGTSEEGAPCSILVIDSEGMGGFDRDTNYDTRVFSIASIISSIFIYNSNGAIDEGAIDSLSLIVNLAKLVQSNNLSSFFPKFIWILRDFSLELVDETGSPIEANEYLEKALKEVKGFSDSVEKKNRIRNSLKGYYQQRECVLMIRPTNDDRKLQQLDELELTELRPKFVEQVMELRKKITFKAKIKKIGGAEVNGELIVRLLEDCVKSFNDGGIPNIDSTWGYICKSQNRKVLDESVDMYGKLLTDNTLPMEESELSSAHKEAKAEALKYLKKNILSQDNDLVKNYKQMVQEKFEEAKMQNQYELKLHYMTFLKDQFTFLDSEIKNGKFSSMNAFEKNLKLLEKEYFENTLPGQLKSEIFLTFAREISNKAADFLISFFTNETKMQKLAYEDLSEKLTAEIREAKESFGQVRSDLEKTNSKLSSDLAVTTSHEKTLKDQLLTLQSCKEDLEQTIKDLQKNKSSELSDLKSKYSSLESSMKDLQRKHNNELSEVEDEKALLSQKLSFTESSLEEFKVKDRNYSERLKEFRAEQSQSQKLLQSKYEQQIEKLTERLNEKTKENNDLENEVELKEALLEQVQNLLNEAKAKLDSIKSQSESEINDLKAQLQDKESFYLKKIEKIEQDYKVSTSRLRARLSETEKKLRNSDELLRNDMAIWAQDNAILVQKIEFLEQEVEELKAKNEEEKKRYTSIISTLEAGIQNDD